MFAGARRFWILGSGFWILNAHFQTVNLPSGRQAVNGGLDRGKDRVSEAGRSCSDEYIGGLQICIINED